MCVGTIKFYSFNSVDFVIAGLIMVGFVSTYLAVILLGFQMLFIITGSLLSARYSGVPL